jgi:4'-phosphopantetheinyl transferase
VPGPLAEGVVHLYSVALDAPDERVRACAAMLSPDERERAARFVFERDRRRYVVARGALRTVLAGYLDVAPDELELTYGARGKPSLRAPLRSDWLRFNLAHSGELAMFAITCGRELGIDVEWVRPVEEALAIAEYYFCPAERATLTAAVGAARLATFFTYWTRKEAILKATGEGLGLPLDCVDVAWTQAHAPSPHPVQVRDLAGADRRFAVVDLQPAHGYIASLAVEAEAEPPLRLIVEVLHAASQRSAAVADR